MNIKDFKVGDTVYILNYHFRSSEDQATVEEAVVVKVTYKYVTVAYEKGRVEYKFHNEQNKPYYLVQQLDAGTPNKLFKTEKAIDDWRQSEKLYTQIRRYFGTYYNTLTMDQLIKIKDIIGLED